MSTTTTKMGLVKPGLTDSADITAMNQNWDKIDEKLGDAISKKGDTLNGTLMMKKVEGMGHGSWYKNHSDTLDSGTVLSDVDADGNIAQIIARAKTQQIIARFSNDNVDHEIFGEHNIDLAQKSMHIFYTLDDIGLTEGSETIEDVARYLPGYSRLLYTVGGSNNLSIYPNSNYGLLIVDKTINTRIMFTFINNSGVKWNGVYVISSATGNTWTGWTMTYNDKYITSGVVDLNAGSTAISTGRFHFIYE